MLAKSCLNLWLQVLNSSDRSFRLAVSGWKIIRYFSLVHKLHFLVTGLKSLAHPSIFQFTLKSLFLSCSCHTWVKSVVECSFFRFKKLWLWPLNCFLNVFLVKPVYVCLFKFSSITSSPYTTDFTKQFPPNGQGWLHLYNCIQNVFGLPPLLF